MSDESGKCSVMVEKQRKNEAEKNESQHCEVAHGVPVYIFVMCYISLESALKDLPVHNIFDKN